MLAQPSAEAVVIGLAVLHLAQTVLRFSGRSEFFPMHTILKVRISGLEPDVRYTYSWSVNPAHGSESNETVVQIVSFYFLLFEKRKRLGKFTKSRKLTHDLILTEKQYSNSDV